MLISAFFRRLNIPCDATDLPFNRLTRRVENRYVVWCNFRKLTVVQIDCISRVGNQCCNIRGKVIFTYAYTEDQRTCFSCHVYLFGLVGTNNTKRIRSLQSCRCFNDRLFQIACIVHLNQMHYYLRIRLAFKTITLLYQLFTQSDIVFDNAVMNNSELAVIAHVRMGIGIGRRTVSSPSSMSDADRTREILTVSRSFAQISNPSGNLADSNQVIVEYSNAC